MNDFEKGLAFESRQMEFGFAATVMVAEVVRSFAVHMVPNPPQILWYVGDYAGGHVGTWFLNATMGTTPFLNRLSERTKIKISSGLTLATVLAVETFPLFGTPRVEDIPAGVLGVLGSLGVRKLAQRWVGLQVK